MARTFDRPLVIQKINEVTEQWEDAFRVHASVNKASSDSEYLNAGSVRSKQTLTFEVRYFKDLEDISLNLQGYRIVFQGVPYNITDYDDFMLMHKTVKFLGASY